VLPAPKRYRRPPWTIEASEKTRSTPEVEAGTVGRFKANEAISPNVSRFDAQKSTGLLGAVGAPKISSI